MVCEIYVHVCVYTYIHVCYICVRTYVHTQGKINWLPY